MNQEIYEAVWSIIGTRKIEAVSHMVNGKWITKLSTKDIKHFSETIAEAVPGVDEIVEIVHRMPTELKFNSCKHCAKAIYDTLLKNLRGKK